MSLKSKRALLGLLISLTHLYFWMFIAYLTDFSMTIAVFIASLFLNRILKSLDNRIGWKW